MKKVTLFAISSTGKPKQWAIWTEKGGYVCQEWGFVDGKKQETKDLVKQKNVGKTNETSLEEQAELEAERKLTKKKEEGYSQSLKTSNNSEINWEDAVLPDTFAPSKPETSISEEDEEALVKSGNAIYQRKHNGMRVFAVVGTNGKINFYSRRLERKTDNFPNYINGFQIFPKGTILDCEMVANDDPDLIKTIFGAQPEKAIERQKSQKIEFIIFDILYYHQESIANKSYEDRYKILNSYFNKGRNSIHYISVVENILKPKKIPEHWEGLILRDRTSPMKIRFDGKPDRKSGSWKIKNFKEADLICRSWEYGKGRLNNDVATLNLGAYDKNNKYVAICQSGSGLTDELRRIIKQKSPQGKFVDLVFEIKYEERTPGGSLRLPIILRLRDDKNPSECKVEDIL